MGDIEQIAELVLHVSLVVFMAGNLLAIAKQKYTINYSPTDNGATGPPPSDEADLESVLSK